jgi:hypothetical protein
MRSDQNLSHLTATSSRPPAAVFCPTCARGLVFRGALAGDGVGGDAGGERWNEYECPACGRFEFRCRRAHAESPEPG